MLARILGEVPGVVDAGELRWEWQYGVLEQRPCGCGRGQRDCPVWNRIVPQVLGVEHAADDELEAAARELVGAGVVIETSKRAQDAALLAGVPGIEHYVLHLVRDPRAVGHSWRRAKP